MKLRNDTGVPTFVIAAVVLSCAAPAGALNIWPRVEQILHEGVTGNQIGIVLLVTMSALGMAAVPFAMKKAENLGFWIVCLLFGTFLATLNYALAVGAIGKAKDSETNSAAFLVSESQRLKKQISELKATISEAPKFKYTSEEMVASARQAVDLALQARDQECGKVGDNCRARVAQLASRQSELADAVTGRATTSNADRRDADLRAHETMLYKLGTIPDRIDPQAERLRALLSAVGIVTNVQKVADGLISVLAISAEAFALLMPRILVTALASGPPGPALPAGAIMAQIVGPRKPPAKPPGAARSLPIGRVPVWPRPRKQKLEAWTAFLAYKKWCAEHGLAPASFTAFMFELTNAGVKKAEENGKAYFTF